jgi:hypothetical protein
MSEPKRYPITFTTDFTDQWYQKPPGAREWTAEMRSAICQKYRGQSISLEELPALVAEVGSVIFTGETVEIYNDFRE